MSWRISQLSYRESLLKRNDDQDALRYHRLVSPPTHEEQEAQRQDIRDVFTLRDGASVLEPGAGTGVFTQLLLTLADIELTVQEPSESMLKLLRREPSTQEVQVRQGFCDSIHDRDQFPTQRFDLIVSRMLVNSLYDPLSAFSNWHFWLKPEGAVIVIDGLFQASAWTGAWKQDVDCLPMSACESLAMVPYLLENTGFVMQHCGLMTRTNALPSPRTPRYIVVARKP